MNTLTLGLDPGRDKCGLALVDSMGSCIFHQVVKTQKLGDSLRALGNKYGFGTIVMGNGTTSKEAAAVVTDVLPNIRLAVVDEYRTTDAAREEYWKINPPTGWKRLLPRGMLVPPVPVDDLAAMILARRYVAGRNG